jgi:hypothetical protein
MRFSGCQKPDDVGKVLDDFNKLVDELRTGKKE